MGNHYKYTEAETISAFKTSIVDIAKTYFPNIEDEGKAYRIPGFAGLFLFKHGTGYWRHSTDEHGTGIDFLVKYCGVASKQDAIGMILNSPGRDPSASILPVPKSEQEQGKFLLPKKAPDYKRVYAYLLNTRKIDKEIVSRLMGEKKIFQEADRGNCVFVGYDKNSIARYATKRGTSDTPFKGEVANSDKSFAFHIAGKPDSHRVIVSESPIDAMSHASLMKLHGKDWSADHHIALGGLSDKALEQFLQDNPQITNIVFALDNDYEAINQQTGKLENHGQLAAEKYIAKYSDKGYKCLNHVPQEKDFNEDLLNFHQVALEEEMVQEA